VKRLQQFALVCLACIVVVAPTTASESGSPSAAVNDLLNRAEALAQLGVVEKGAGRSFNDALDLVDTAAEHIEGLDLSPDERQALALEINMVRKNLEQLLELNEERFYGTFRLTRLVLPSLLAGDEPEPPEQLFHPPRLAASEIAARKFANEMREYDHPRIVMRGLSAEDGFDTLALQVFLGDERSLPVTRRQLVRALNADDLQAFDRGEFDPELIGRVLEACDAVSLVVLTVEPVFEVDEITVKVVFRGDLFVPGELVQGSPVGASVVIHSTSLVAAGMVRDRRDQFWPIVGAQLLLLALAMAWAARIRWSLDRPLKLFYRPMIGMILFAFGRVFVLANLVLLRKVIPDPSALAAVAWWWPAILGLLAILGVGLVAWVGQARLTDIIPGARGARAVGSIFALTALGAASYFVAPLLLLDGSSGFSCLVPFILASLGLAVLFGFAARTGPPVPYWFAIGPFFAAPLVGTSLLMASPGWLWSTVGLTGAMGLAAWIRHRYAVAHGTEEPEPTSEEAAAADQQRLAKLQERLTKKP